MAAEIRCILGISFCVMSNTAAGLTCKSNIPYVSSCEAEWLLTQLSDIPFCVFICSRVAHLDIPLCVFMCNRVASHA